MDAKKIMAMLPERPREGMIEAAVSENVKEFGGGFLIYYREALVEETVPQKAIMKPEDWEACRNGCRHFWGAVCACTECGETWLTGWAKGGKISLREGPDGTMYENYDGDTVSPDSELTPVSFGEGDTIPCPRCNKNVTLIRRKNIRRGRTYRLMIASVENIGDYTAVLYWLVSRRLDSYGDSDINVSPYAAVVIDRDGTPTFFSRACYAYGCLTIPAARWKPVKRMFDPSQTRYRSYEATNGIKLGGWAWGNVPDVTGKTGEKTGLADYVREGGGWPFLYLLFWRRYPVIENVVKSGWTFTLDDCIATDARNKRYRLRFPDALEELMDWNYARPRDILNVSRKAAAMGREWQWDCATFCLWKELFDFGCALPEHAEDFQNYLTDYGYQNMDRFVACVTDGEEYVMPEIDRYLKRQRRKYGLDLRTGMEALFDYRFMLDKILDGRTPGEDELWPKNLRTAHDRAVTAYHAKEQSATAGFAEILERWGALQWTDGEYRAILPRCLADLTNEGHTLHHCVGSYSRSHAEGKIVVFIRRYRRPERSYFTLNEDLTGDRPRRIQLHGYGNEYANGKRLTIPKKVLDFCDRWERDVLIPVFREVMENEAKEKATKKRKSKTTTNRAAP